MASELIIFFFNKRTNQYVKDIDLKARKVSYVPSAIEVLRADSPFVSDSEHEASNFLPGIRHYMPRDQVDDIVLVKFVQVKPAMTTLPGFR